LPQGPGFERTMEKGVGLKLHLSHFR